MSEYNIAFVRFDETAVSYSHPRDRTPPFTAAISAGMLAEAGYFLRVYELPVQKIPSQKAVNFVKTCSILFIEINACQSEDARQFIKRLDGWKGVVAAYGFLSVHRPEAILEEGLAEFCITGEGEAVIPDFVKWLSNGREGEIPSGLIWLHDGAFQNSGTSYLATTDQLPFMPRSFLDSNYYHKNSFPISISKTLLWGFVIGSRGCCYNCKFCTAMTRQSLKKNFRLCSPDRLINEMEFQVQRSNRNIISIEDDLFTGDREWAMIVCSELINRNWTYPWTMQTRFDCLDLKLLKILKSAGCVGISCGLESGSDTVLKNLNKRLSTDCIKEVGNWIKDLGFNARYTVMIGSPGESNDDYKKTVSLVSKLNPVIAHMSYCTAYVDTELAEFSDDAQQVFRFDSPGRNLSLIDDNDLSLLRFHFYKRFYFSRSYLRTHLKTWVVYFVYNPTRMISFVFRFIIFTASQLIRFPNALKLTRKKNLRIFNEN